MRYFFRIHLTEQQLRQAETRQHLDHLDALTESELIGGSPPEALHDLYDNPIASLDTAEENT